MLEAFVAAFGVDNISSTEYHKSAAADPVLQVSKLCYLVHSGH